MSQIWGSSFRIESEDSILIRRLVRLIASRALSVLAPSSEVKKQKKTIRVDGFCFLF
jgi:hypothetical protein